MHCVCGMQEGSSHVSTCTTKDEFDGVEELGGEFVWEEEHSYVFTYTTKAMWNGGGRGLWRANILVTANLCFTRPKEIIWITVD